MPGFAEERFRRFPPSYLCAALFTLLRRIDRGAQCDPEDVSEMARAGALTSWLRSEGVDTSLITDDRRAKLDAFFQRADDYAGIHHNGYVLVATWLLEALQELVSEGDWWKRDD
jgi:hypothetical protein